MLFLVEMTVHFPREMDAGQAERLRASERAAAERLQRDGAWLHLWRIAGRYANVSVFDVASTDELHEIVSGLPLWPYMDVSVTPLAHHPSAIEPRVPQHQPSGMPGNRGE